MLLISKKKDVQIFAINSLENISSKIWNNLNEKNNPFLRYEFLFALEKSNCVEKKSGWNTLYILAFREKQLIGALPNYLKSHSYGEYVFDHSWANAYQKMGRNYYPKMLVAVPFTPVPGDRVLFKKENSSVSKLLISSLIEFTQKNNISSVHINFISNKNKTLLKNEGWHIRTGIQFHWHNNNYSNFESFLSSLSSRKRKNIKKERDYIKKNNIVFKQLTGEKIKQFNWENFYKFYLTTIEKKWGGAYLQKSFFDLIGEKMSKHILLIIAEKNNQMIAGALNFIGKDTLYGRNWGCLKDIPFLHFETCYYQAIDYAIKNKISKIEAGVQGLHKVQRGYVPIKTYSAHWLHDNNFSKAINKFLLQEKSLIDNEISALRKISPYKKYD